MTEKTTKCSECGKPIGADYSCWQCRVWAHVESYRRPKEIPHYDKDLLERTKCPCYQMSLVEGAKCKSNGW